MAPDGRVTSLSSYVVNYLTYLVSDFYSPIIDKVLKAEQNWLGQGRSDERGLAQGVLLFMQALERQVEGLSKEYSDNGLRHIFLMNNIWYMRSRAKECELGQLLGEAWLKDQRRKVLLLLVKFPIYCFRLWCMSEVVFEFERGATYFGSPRANLILARP